jgi:hypothetical protein
LDGAVCASTRARFASAIGEASGRVQERSIAGEWAVPTLTGHLPAGTPRPVETDLPVETADVFLPWPIRLVDYPVSRFTDRSRTARSFWSWTARRFLVRRTQSESGIEIERLRHNGDRSEDVFRVVRPDGISEIVETRTSAIMMGHKYARRRLFEFSHNKGLLTRTANEGSLPREAARYLRYRHLCGPGLISSDGKAPVYAYPVDRADCATLQGWFGQEILNTQDVDPNDPIAASVLGRRFGAAGRLLAARHQLRGI